jgi:serine/threonine-protein kinase
VVADSVSDCPGEETLAAFVGGVLPPVRLAPVEAHLAGCAACRGVVADAAYGAEETKPGPAGQHSRDEYHSVATTHRLGGGGEHDAPPPEVGDRIAGKYLVERRLGSGGMGVVIAARHIELGQRVAIKILHRRGEAVTARFLREARICARLASDHIPRVFDVGRLDNGAPYIVMEYLVGEDLGRLVARGPLVKADAVGYLLDACAALSAAHAAGIVHRDLKPANLFLTTRSDGRPVAKVLDFGISKSSAAEEEVAPLEGALTSTGTMLGSPLYMSPEQIRARKDVDARTDIWALGVILYELLTGRQPFRAPTLAAAAVAIAVEAPTPPSRLQAELPPALDAVILRCLEKEPRARFQSVDALAKALRPFATGDVATVFRWPWRRRPATWMAVTLAIVLAGAAAVLSARAPEDRPPRDRATAPLPSSPQVAEAAPRAATTSAPAAGPPSVERRQTTDPPAVAPQPPPPAKRRRLVRPGPLDTPD